MTALNQDVQGQPWLRIAAKYFALTWNKEQLAST
jgi:hypothetical protein